jgi:uncharacterized damage-inducible protein DinB
VARVRARVRRRRQRRPHPEVASFRETVAAGYDAYLAALAADTLGDRVPYVNSAGAAFETPIGEILLHVALHGQYHRGKINLLLRQSSAEPAPTDYIAFTRGAPAARTPVG